MRLRVFLIALFALSAATADTLTLRNGRVVEGSYLGGTARQVRMAVGDRVESFAVSEVASIQFEGAQAAAAAPAPAPAPERQVLSTPKPAVTRPAAAAQTTASSANEIPAGSEIVIRMIDDVDSTVNRVGETFRASIDEPVVLNGRTVIPTGADAKVKLVEMQDPSKLGGGGQLSLDLASVTVNGRELEVMSQSVSQAGESRKKESATVIGGTAALGAIIGAIAGGGKGAAIGAVSGAGAGTAVQVLTQGTRVRIPSETRLTFTLQRPIGL